MKKVKKDNHLEIDVSSQSFGKMTNYNNSNMTRSEQEIMLKDFLSLNQKKPSSEKIMRSNSSLNQDILKEPVTIRDLELGKCLGSGKFGDVYMCRHKKTNTAYALKKIFKSTVKEYQMEEQFIKELKIHYRLNHPHIVKLYTHFDDEYHIFLLMEYADGGILMNHLKKGEAFVSNAMHQMLQAVDYLQKNEVALWTTFHPK